MSKKRRKLMCAHEIQIFDNNDRLRGILSGQDSSGSPVLQLFDEKHFDRIHIGLDANGAASIAILNEQGQVMVGLGSSIPTRDYSPWQRQCALPGELRRPPESAKAEIHANAGSVGHDSVGHGRSQSVHLPLRRRSHCWSAKSRIRVQ